MDLMQFRDPIEVFKAAIGNTEPLAARLRSNENIYPREREAIALLVSGKLIPPRRKRNIEQEIIDYYARKEYSRKIEKSVFLYRHLMNKLKEQGRAYGMSKEVIAYVSDRDGIHSEKVLHEVRRANRSPREREEHPLHGEYGDLVGIFERWCHMNWKEVQQYRSRKRV